VTGTWRFGVPRHRVTAVPLVRRFPESMVLGPIGVDFPFSSGVFERGFVVPHIFPKFDSSALK